MKPPRKMKQSHSSDGIAASAAGGSPRRRALAQSIKSGKFWLRLLQPWKWKRVGRRKRPSRRRKGGSRRSNGSSSGNRSPVLLDDNKEPPSSPRATTDNGGEFTFLHIARLTSRRPSLSSSAMIYPFELALVAPNALVIFPSRTDLSHPPLGVVVFCLGFFISLLRNLRVPRAGPSITDALPSA